MKVQTFSIRIKREREREEEGGGSQLTYICSQGAWFYSQQATDGCKNARAMAQKSTTTAWEWFSTVYLADCVGVDITAQTARTEDWNRALQAFGISNDTTNSGS